MSEQENIDLVTRFCDAWSNYDIAKILDFFTDDAVYHNMPIQAVQGKDAIKGMIEQFMAWSTCRLTGLANIRSQMPSIRNLCGEASMRRLSIGIVTNIPREGRDIRW